MRIIIATLVVITVALGLVDTAGAFDPNTFWEEQQLQGGGGS
jgi:hypothetical protein